MEKHDVRKANGTFKGLIGECMFKLTDKWVVLTRFQGRKRYFESFGKYLSQEQIQFLDRNWYSLDAIKIQMGNVKKVMLYEVKCRNSYKNPKSFWRNILTPATVSLYEQAITLGFEVQVATVWLIDNWEYLVTFEDFEHAEYSVDAQKYEKRSANN